MMRLLLCLVLLAEVLLFYRKILFDSVHFMMSWDLRYYHFPQSFFVARQFQAGEFPLWNPWVYGGMPWFAKLDSGLFYPPANLFILLSNWFGGRRLWYFLELEVVAHILLGGVFAYWLARNRGLSMAPSLVTASVFQLGAFFTSQATHMGGVSAAAWMPLAWLALFHLHRRFTLKWLAVLALALGLTILAGYPTVGIPVFASCALLASILALNNWRVLPACAAAMVWALALAALPLIPMMELTKLSHAGLRLDWPIGQGGITPQALWTLVNPNHFGLFSYDATRYNLPWDITFLYLYCGLLPLAFFAAALVKRWREAAVSALIAVAFLLWLLGTNTPAGSLIFHALPRAARASLYFEFGLCVFVLALALTAGYGADALLGGRARWMHVAAVAIVAADLTWAGSGRVYQLTDRIADPGMDSTHLEGNQEIVQTARAYARRTKPPLRMELFTATPLWNNGSMLVEVPFATGDDPFAPLRVLQVRGLYANGPYWTRSNPVTDLSSPVLDLLNAGYIVARQELTPKEAARWELARQVGHQWFYRNPNVLPRFFLAGQTVAAKDAADALAKLKTVDLKKVAIVENAPAVTGTGGHVEVVDYAANRLALRTRSDGPSFLVTSETHYPGWEATLDGKPVELYLTNAAFRGLPVPPGTHEVKMEFRPDLRLAATIAVLAWLLCLGCLMTYTRKFYA